MGLKRWIWHGYPIGLTIDTVKNMVDEGSVVDGIKRTVKEHYTEDNPITSMVYKAGKYDGKKEGYVEASDEYEAKLLQQAEEFLRQKKELQDIDEQKEELLNELIVEIGRLEKKVTLTEAENQYLKKLLFYRESIM